MRIRGCSKPACNLCAYCLHDLKENTFMCSKNNTPVKAEDSCKQFKYDIFKYTPSQKNDLGNFSKEDFEI